MARNRAKRLLHNFVVRFRFHHKQIDKKEPFKWDIVSIQNLSSSGILFNYNQKIPLKTIMEFKISLPFEDGLIHCLGVVCRMEEPPPTKRTQKIPIYKIAAYFTEIDNNTQAKMDHFIHNFDPSTPFKQKET